MTSRKAPAPARGSILVEGLLTLGSVTLFCLLNLELVRRARLETRLHFAAFAAVRRQAIGGPSRLAGSGWGRVRFENGHSGRGLWVSAHRRYPTLLSFPVRGYRKHHFEITHRCTFPSSP